MQLNVNDEVFRAYAFYSGILAVKLFVMSLLTARQRFSKKVFANPEDTALDKGSKVKYDDLDVERVRRAHLNDLENILPFFPLAFLYCLTSPEAAFAKLLFAVFTGARVVHTFVYAVVPLPQPSRALAFGVAMLINVYMACKVITHFA